MIGARLEWRAWSMETTPIRAACSSTKAPGAVMATVFAPIPAIQEIRPAPQAGVPVRAPLLPPVARGDDLSAAQARQRAIAARIAAQRARLAQLTSQQRSLSSSIATTNDALREVNADLAVVQKRIDGLSAAVDEAQA